MAIENFQHVYDHPDFYRRALIPVSLFNLCGYQKEQQLGTTNKNSIKICKTKLTKFVQ